MRAAVVAVVAAVVLCLPRLPRLPRSDPPTAVIMLSLRFGFLHLRQRAKEK